MDSILYMVFLRTKLGSKLTYDNYIKTLKRTKLSDFEANFNCFNTVLILSKAAQNSVGDHSKFPGPQPH